MQTKKILRYILYTYIILCIIIAGLNYGLGPNADYKTKHTIESIWHFYENGFKVIMILLVSYFTYRIIKKDKHYAHRKRNIIGLIITSLLLHVILPVFLGTYDLYFFSMPAPFTNTGMQLINTNSTYYQQQLPLWGKSTIAIISVLFIAYSAFIYLATYFRGRQVQCSTLCLFNGFIGEIFSPIFLPKKKAYKFLKPLRSIFMILGIFFTGYWIYRFLVAGSLPILEQIEIFKYLIGELFVAMFLWVTFTGRGYCYYCPLGTTLAQVAKIGDMRIDTTENKCIQCGKCNRVCPMNIDIQSQANLLLPVRSTLCVGCGHCVDACPSQTLKYRTKFIKS